jgi:FtsP/CotA-like multicopper oxidase with cupredoxin domain
MSVREAVAPQVSTRFEGTAMAAPVRRFAVRSYSGALLIAGAAAIHFAVAPEHFQEYLPYGLFFVSLGLTQLGLAAALLIAPSRRLYVIASCANVAVIAIWLVSRTIGLPLGPDAGKPEPVGFIDLLASVMEAIAVLVLWRRIRIPVRSSRVGRIRLALTTTPALLAAVLAVFTGVGVAANPMMVAYNAAPAVPGQPSTSLVTLIAQPGSEPVDAFTLTAAPVRIGGQDAWAYNGTVPGPELRVTQGHRVRVTLVNHLPAATSIHWHGLIVPNAEDGVSGITQDAVHSGGTYTYEFVAKDAGTYWYHSHQDTSHQLIDGLFGAIVVEPRQGLVAVQNDYTVLVHHLPDASGIEVNGTPNLHLDAAPGDTVRLRLISAFEPESVSDLNPLMPVLVGAPYKVSALDGHDLNQPQELGPERILIGIGQRVDLVFTMPASGSVQLRGLTGSAPFFSFGAKPPTATVTIGDGPAPAAINLASLPRFDMTSYGMPAPDRVADAGHFDVVQQIVLRGGPGFRDGNLNFMDTFNGLASPNIPPIRVREGDLVRIRIVNPSRSYHPIHIHGHVFTVLARNGKPLTGSPVHLDTLLVPPGETWDVGFVADNPGIWMLHCHILNHGASGMSMTINYEGISSPFTMGVRSGNVPE